ncbi:class IV lanthionine synthetase LanL [Sphaerisporangium fuscum]|uniref:class IV lanthionine synthetase LanL n=1 Tax=Sphaerisporangium fuscum TaxID=2835868 RepID=UPI001BDC3968|nr:class IV lanthionine synthetase LanL [Sphaerisporangium fuscum]
MLEDIARGVLGRVAGGAAGWRFGHHEPWMYVTPEAEAGTRAQGWKLHVSATPLSAPVVLARVVEVLGRRGCPFKFAATQDDLTGLVSRALDRGSVGKFITVYPPDDATAREIAEELHRATYGLPGPPILSDRAYLPGSLVHYRFGVFSAPSVLDNDGSYSSRLTAPDGTRVTDDRKAWYSPPAWAVCPFDSGQAPVRTSAPRSVLLADRFEVRKALRHGAKGGVFLAEDRSGGGKVVIKQARPYLGATVMGTDERDQLRHEAAMLDLFGPLGVTARKVLLFERNDNVFLAQEYIEGTPLSGWAGKKDSPASERRDQLVPLIRRLADLVHTVHGQGYVLRDLTPNNVMVMDGGDCRLIDLEMAARPGTPVPRAFTPGYAPPEQQLSARYGPAPGAEADMYALGATALFLLTGCRPALVPDRPAGPRSWDSRVEALVRVATQGDPVAAALAPLILGVMREDPARRWDLPRVRTFLDEMASGPVPSPEPAGAYRLGTEEQDRLLRDGLAHTLRTMTPGTGSVPSPHLWPARNLGQSADPCAVQYGSAGVLALWARLADPARPGEGVPPGLRDDLLAGLRTAADWTVRRLEGEHRPSPGLYFGRAGIAWGLHEAGRALGDERLRAAGLEMALGLPIRWPNPDICHGLAGTGMALLHFWQATGDGRFLERADACADGLLEAAEHTPKTVLWPIPKDFDSALAGVVHYGFAHGVAGIGAYLLAAGRVLGRDDCVETALTAGETLLEAADHDGGRAWWADGPNGGNKLPHWCNGSSGVGTFLVRLHAADGDRRFRDAAHGAALAVHGNRLVSGTAACHGLAGDGQFLLDMADLLGEPAYREQAEELAGALWAHATLRDGLLVVPDENQAEVTVGWNTGLAGVLDFLHRLRHGGPRPWMADPEDGSAPSTSPGGRA